ncbi:putative peptidase [Volucribacter psittacicida]|uniref:Putative peptidase n=1 Tax=Volucribacter psittacicida TaxID=203482 RepID=A0A4R1G0L4_9PAST|nr:alpha/beta hydrolase-fold protein [Volucribacter psittacicida]TCJ98498.1 putative peptidase [Volucribacter psittacicida]
MKKYVLLLLFFFNTTTFAQSLRNTENPAILNVSLLSEITAKGQKITAVALEYEDDLLAGNNLKTLYQVKTSLDQQELQERTLLKAYSNHRPERSEKPQQGRFVIIELAQDDPNADVYQLNKANETPLTVREKNAEGQIIYTQKVQVSRVPQYYQQRLIYHINQTGNLPLVNGKTVLPTQAKQSAERKNIITPFIDQFTSHRIYLNTPDNQLLYRLYTPLSAQQKYPLTIFLHGSGQVGKDNLAQLLSSKGAISTLAYEQGFVLAPQYQTPFDPFDNVEKGQPGGIHWQTDNRQQLLLKMIDQTLANNPNIDTDRIYLIGLSRGAEGALNLLLKRPHFFAGALLLSGREAHSLEWIDGNATKDNLASIQHIPIWFIHSKEDKIAPVTGTQKNYQILRSLNAPFVKYNELTFQQVGDNGIINNNAHNSWDMAFDSPAVMNWLLQQKRTIKE